MNKPIQDPRRYRELLEGMGNRWREGENMLAWARRDFLSPEERLLPGIDQFLIRLAYDFQAGTYAIAARQDPSAIDSWAAQAVSYIEGYLGDATTIMEVGVGEGANFSRIIDFLNRPKLRHFGFDFSFPRVLTAKAHLESKNQEADLFVADLFNIPLPDSSIDLVYTSHSLEPNGGFEIKAVAEILRVSKRWVILMEPHYERATATARKRIEKHGYVKGLPDAIRNVGGKLVFEGLMEYSSVPDNPSGIFIVEKVDRNSTSNQALSNNPRLHCPVLMEQLVFDLSDSVWSESGSGYPKVSGLPILMSDFRLSRKFVT